MLQFEKAFLYFKNEKYSEALKLYEQITPWVQENFPTYQVLLNFYIGEVYMAKSNLNKGEQHFKASIEVSKKYKSHLDFTPLVYARLSDLYLQKGESLKAYEMLKIARELDGKYFDSRSNNNRPLLEIQDAFRLNQEEQKKAAQEQRLLQLEHDEKVFFFKKRY